MLVPNHHIWFDMTNYITFSGQIILLISLNQTHYPPILIANLELGSECHRGKIDSTWFENDAPMHCKQGCG